METMGDPGAAEATRYGTLIAPGLVAPNHVPHMEDWPVMSTMWKGITLMPFNFFAANPALSIRAPE